MSVDLLQNFPIINDHNNQAQAEQVVPPADPVVPVVPPPVVPPEEPVPLPVVPTPVDQLNMYPSSTDGKMAIMVEGPAFHWESTPSFGKLRQVKNFQINEHSKSFIWTDNYEYNPAQDRIIMGHSYPYYDAKENRSFISVSNDQSLLSDINFLRAYKNIMPTLTLDGLKFADSYIIVRSHKKTFNLAAIFGSNMCKLLDSIFIDKNSEVDFDEKDLLQLVFPLYLPLVKKIIYFLVEHNAHHPMVWKYIITNILCRDILTHTNIMILPKLSDEQHLYLRDNLLVQQEISDDDWFGYARIPDAPIIINQTTSLFSSDDLKGHTFTCSVCEEDITASSDDDRDTIALCGIAGSDCECFICIPCALDNGRSLKHLVKQNETKYLTTKCFGCRREITREFYYVTMLLLEYNNFMIDNGKSLYGQLLDKIKKMGSYDRNVTTIHSCMGKLNKSLFPDFICLMSKINQSIDKYCRGYNLSTRKEYYINVSEEVFAFNQAVLQKIRNQHLSWLHSCKNNCGRTFLLNPESEMLIRCPNVYCNKDNLVIGSIKDEANRAVSKEMKQLLENSDLFNCCPNCFKVAERISGCNDMKCYFCGKHYRWDIKTAVSSDNTVSI